MEHAWENHHPIDWEETTVLDHGRGQELLLKEALHIKMTPSDEHFMTEPHTQVLLAHVTKITVDSFKGVSFSFQVHSRMED